MSQPLPFDEIKFDRNVCFESKINTPDDSENGYFVEVDLKYPDKTKEKTNIFPLAPENKLCSQDKFIAHLKKTKPETYMSNKKLICDWTDKKNYFVH